MSTNAERIDRILQAFDDPAERYCRAELDEALTLREEITPRLLSVLDELAADPEAFAAGPGLLHAYAVALLAHFEEPRAHLPIIRAFSLSEELQDVIWGDLATERLPAMLFRTCGGDADALRSVILDRGLEVSVRCAAMDALVVASLKGTASREETLAFFGGLFTGAEADRSSDFWNLLAGAASDLWPKQILPKLKQAFGDELITRDFIGLEEIEEILAEPSEEWLARQQDRLGLHLPADVHGYISWFDCFAPKERPQACRIASVTREESARKKAKKKQAKRSRKKNRR